MPQNMHKDAIFEIISLSFSRPYIMIGSKHVNFTTFNPSKSAVFVKYVDLAAESTYQILYIIAQS